MESIDRFLKFYGSVDGSVDGSGHGHGSGDGSGGGSGSVDGYGSVDGSGYGHGYGSGSVSGYGSGDRSGSGYGSVDGSGYGYGYGDRDGIKFFNGKEVHYIDNAATVILSVKGFVASGYVINRDFTTTSIYVVRVGNCFAHGKTIKQARSDAESKHLLQSPIEDRIDAFTQAFKKTDKIPSKDLYDWHFTLTGSCSFGRDQFIKSNGIDINNDSFTVQEFIELTINEYGGEIIKQLKKSWNE